MALAHGGDRHRPEDAGRGEGIVVRERFRRLAVGDIDDIEATDRLVGAVSQRTADDENVLLADEIVLVRREMPGADRIDALGIDAVDGEQQGRLPY